MFSRVNSLNVSLEIPTASGELVPSSPPPKSIKHTTATGDRRYLKYQEGENCSKKEQHQK